MTHATMTIVMSTLALVAPFGCESGGASSSAASDAEGAAEPDATPAVGPDAGSESGADAGVDTEEEPVDPCAETSLCDDQDACTTDLCGIGGACSYEAVLCNDGNSCNGSETCDPQTGCVSGVPTECSDGNPCNGNEACDPQLGCTAGVPLPCNDDNICNGIEACDPAVGCTPGTTLDCEDGDACNGHEICDVALGCVAGEPLAGCCTSVGDCNDDNPCNGNENCDAETFVCSTGEPPVCDDGNPCNGTEGCLTAGEQIGCQVTAAGFECNDGNPCNGLEVCDSVVGCLPGAAKLCDDGKICTLDTCDAVEGCLSSPVDCDDGQICTIDSCNQQSGACDHQPADCDDGDPCNGEESCVLDTGCVNGEPPEGPCSEDFSIEFVLETGTDGAPCAGTATCTVTASGDGLAATLAVVIRDGGVEVPGAKVFYEVIEDPAAMLSLDEAAAFTGPDGVAAVLASAAPDASGSAQVQASILGHDPVTFTVEVSGLSATITSPGGQALGADEHCAWLYLSAPGTEADSMSATCDELVVLSDALPLPVPAASACAPLDQSLSFGFSLSSLGGEADLAGYVPTLLVAARGGGVIVSTACLEGATMASDLLWEAELSPTLNIATLEGLQGMPPVDTWCMGPTPDPVAWEALPEDGGEACEISWELLQALQDDPTSADVVCGDLLAAAVVSSWGSEAIYPGIRWFGLAQGAIVATGCAAPSQSDGLDAMEDLVASVGHTLLISGAMAEGQEAEPDELCAAVAVVGESDWDCEAALAGDIPKEAMSCAPFSGPLVGLSPPIPMEGPTDYLVAAYAHSAGGVPLARGCSAPSAPGLIVLELFDLGTSVEVNPNALDLTGAWGVRYHMLDLQFTVGASPLFSPLLGLLTNPADTLATLFCAAPGSTEAGGICADGFDSNLYTYIEEISYALPVEPGVGLSAFGLHMAWDLESTSPGQYTVAEQLMGLVALAQPDGDICVLSDPESCVVYEASPAHLCSVEEGTGFSAHTEPGQFATTPHTLLCGGESIPWGDVLLALLEGAALPAVMGLPELEGTPMEEWVQLLLGGLDCTPGEDCCSAFVAEAAAAAPALGTDALLEDCAWVVDHVQTLVADLIADSVGVSVEVGGVAATATGSSLELHGDVDWTVQKGSGDEEPMWGPFEAWKL